MSIDAKPGTLMLLDALDELLCLRKRAEQAQAELPEAEETLAQLRARKHIGMAYDARQLAEAEERVRELQPLATLARGLGPDMEAAARTWGAARLEEINEHQAAAADVASRAGKARDEALEAYLTSQKAYDQACNLCINLGRHAGAIQRDPVKAAREELERRMGACTPEQGSP